MATYREPDQTMLVLQALRLYHGHFSDKGEIVVVDNDPIGSDARRLERFCREVRAKYVPFPEPVGTAAPREEIFRHATGDVVCVIDSHLLFPQPVLKHLATWGGAFPGDMNLWQGPFLRNDRSKILASHMVPEWGRGPTLGRWRNDERAKKNDAFEIPMQGLGMFACRRDAWVGMPPGLRGFGGVEWILHEKFRQAGRKVVCLPWFRGWHLFRAKGKAPPYPVRLEDRFRNYLIGFRHLGLDEAEVFAQFRPVLGDRCERIAGDIGPVERFDPTALTKEPPAIPAPWKRAWNFGKAVKKYVAAGRPRVTEAMHTTRGDICEANRCGLRNGDVCAHPSCGCNIEAKSLWATETCPLGLWPELTQLDVAKPAVPECQHQIECKSRFSVSHDAGGRDTLTSVCRCTKCGQQWVPVSVPMERGPVPNPAAKNQSSSTSRSPGK